jgi:hypothetical protein
MVGECFDCSYSIRHHPYGNVGKLTLNFETALTVARSLETVSATTSLSFIRLAVASSTSSALVGKELRKHINSGARQIDQGFPRLLWVFVVTNAIAALAQWCSGISIIVITLATRSISIWWYQWVFLVRFSVLNLGFHRRRI